METIRTTSNNVKITISKKLFSLLDKVVEFIEKKYYNNEVDLYDEDYVLEGIRFQTRGIDLFYKNHSGTFRGYIQYEDLVEYMEAQKSALS